MKSVALRKSAIKPTVYTMLIPLSLTVVFIMKNQILLPAIICIISIPILYRIFKIYKNKNPVLILDEGNVKMNGTKYQLKEIDTYQFRTFEGYRFYAHTLRLNIKNKESKPFVSINELTLSKQKAKTQIRQYFKRHCIDELSEHKQFRLWNHEID